MSEILAGSGDREIITFDGAQCFGLVNTGHRVMQESTKSCGNRTGSVVLMHLGGAGIESQHEIFFKPAMETVEYPDYTKKLSFQILSCHQCCVVPHSAGDQNNPHCNMRQKWAVLERCYLYRW